jgi:outer membrane protein assembly factor BamB
VSYPGTWVWGYTVANGNVYLAARGSDLQPHGGVVSCLNAPDGTEIWSYGVDAVLRIPIVDGNTVYVPGYVFTLSTGDSIGYIFAFDAYTGTEKWSFQGPSRSSFTSLILTGGNLYAPSGRVIYAFEASTGEGLWNYSAPGDTSSILVSGQNIYALYERGVLALNASDGTKIWECPISGSVGSPILADDTVYASSGDGNVYALDVANGTVKWNNQTGLSTGSILLVDSYLYVGTSSGVLCLNALTGHGVWNFEAEEYAQSSATFPLYADGVIYVGWNGPQFYLRVLEHDFYALDALSGEKIGNYTLAYAVKNPPTIVDGTIYIAASGVTSQNRDIPQPGAVVALNSTITLSPSAPPSPPLPPSDDSSESSSPPSDLAVQLIALGGIAVAIVSAAVIVYLWRKK